ncbi:glycosyltransferase family 2 protein [Halomarina litorea]|uniref:glycosyltransferase family 2 protein n=1 Tax=Halomarina litorea TaxID=2961595 RepID=UPI0020C3B878|nr:glycosyltransferase family 2 protein [Halomarina sp. BCD28]
MAVGSDDTPLASVVLPTYGRPDFLTEAVESVLSQTYERVELLVVDDCSPDPVAPVLDGIDPEAYPGERTLRVVRHEENRGANGARNTGIEEADGEFVAFIDDDDLWAATKLERQLAAFDDPEVGAVYTGMRYVADGETVHVLEPTLAGDVTEALLVGAPLGTFSTIAVRASVARETGPLDERFPCWQDREWPIRLSTRCRFGVVPDVLVDHRTTDHEQITDDFAAKRDVAYPLFVETFRPLAAEYGVDTVRKMAASRSRAVATSALKAGEYDDARRFALRAVRERPTDASAYLLLLLALGGQPVFTAAQRTSRALAAFDE